MWKGFKEEFRDGGSQVQKIRVGSDMRFSVRSTLQLSLPDLSQDDTPNAFITFQPGNDPESNSC